MWNCNVWFWMWLVINIWISARTCSCTWIRPITAFMTISPMVCKRMCFFILNRSTYCTVLPVIRIIVFICPYMSMFYCICLCQIGGVVETNTISVSRNANNCFMLGCPLVLCLYLFILNSPPLFIIMSMIYFSDIFSKNSLSYFICIWILMNAHKKRVHAFFAWIPNIIIP